MNSVHKPVFLVISNNSSIAELIKLILQKKDVVIKISSIKEINNINDSNLHYIIFVSENNRRQTTSTTDIINIYELAKRHNSKLAIIDIFEQEPGLEDNNTVFQLLTQIAGDRPLFRYLITKNVFQFNNNQAVFGFEKELRQTIVGEKINVSTKGENLLYPISLDDLLAATLKSLFIEDTAGEKLTIIGEPLKDLDLAYLIKQELEKENKTLDINTIQINRRPENELQNSSANSRALLKWLPKDDSEDLLAQKISQLIKIKSQASGNPIPIKTKPSNEDLHKKEKKLFITIPLIILVLVALGLLTTSIIWIGLINLSVNKTTQSLEQLREAKIDQAKNDLIVAQKSLETAGQIGDYLLPSYQIMVPKLVRESNTLESFLKHLQSTVQLIQESYSIGENLYLSLLTRSDNNSALDLSLALQSRLRTILQELSQLKIISQKQLTQKLIIQKLEKINFSGRINILENQTTQGLKLLEPFSQFLISTGPQQIAVIIQDSNEIKSTGGAIRQLVIATLDQQKVVNIYSIPINQIDKHLTGQIIAPAEISKLTGNESLWFSNSNNSPSFPETAQSIQKFLINSQNINPGIIITVNTPLLEGILNENGQTDGIFETQILQEIQTNNTSPTLSQLIEKLITDLKTKPMPLIKLARPIINSITEDQIRIWFSNIETEKLIANQSFSGIISPSFCHPLLSGNNCFTDTVSFNESNYSIFPFNYYQNRQVQHQLNIQENQIEHIFLINYQYKENTPRPNRDYQALYQIYLHKDAQFIGLEKNNQEINQEVNKEISNNLSLFQIPVAHKTPEPTVVKLTFKVPLNKYNPSQIPFAYTLKTYHQPGTKASDYQITINYPENLSISTVTASVNIKDQKIIYQPPSGGISVLGLQFGRD